LLLVDELDSVLVASPINFISAVRSKARLL
jgi:hypothetical protein